MDIQVHVYINRTEACTLLHDNIDDTLNRLQVGNSARLEIPTLWTIGKFISTMLGNSHLANPARVHEYRLFVEGKQYLINDTRQLGTLLHGRLGGSEVQFYIEPIQMHAQFRLAGTITAGTINFYGAPSDRLGVLVGTIEQIAGVSLQRYQFRYDNQPLHGYSLLTFLRDGGSYTFTFSGNMANIAANRQ